MPAKKPNSAAEAAIDAGFNPADFDEVELPSVEPDDDEEEFDDADFEGLSAMAGPSAEALLAARDQLEQRLLVGVSDQAFAAASGTDELGFENIVGVGIGEKVTAGRLTGQMAVRVYVAAKEGTDAVATAAMVPESVNGVPTDVVLTGEFEAQPHKGRYRPAPGGVSVAHFKVTAGTLGCLVRKGRLLYILSNNHVLANSNNASAGDPIVQPGPLDGGRVPADVIARLSAFVPIQFGGGVNLVDAAIAQTSPKLVTPINKCFGRIQPTPVACSRDMLVMKCGRTTQATRGRIVDCNATVRVNYRSAGVALFRNQILIVSLVASPFSQGGDSGSLILNSRSRRPVGLLFAGSATHTVANPIGAVLSALGVTIVA